MYLTWRMESMSLIIHAIGILVAENLSRESVSTMFVHS
jgi:hypothetical protein